MKTISVVTPVYDEELDVRDRQRMFRRRPAPDSIRGGRRFAAKNMRQRMNLEHVPIP